jgi:predicted DCC family thiol-disulfide oxidoreductase YuxK
MIESTGTQREGKQAMNTLSMPLLTVYYDGQCRLCSAEMAEIWAMDPHGEIRFVDCSPADFDDADARRAGIPQSAMLDALHVRDVLGDWHRGVDAIALVYATAGAPWLARAWASPITRPLTRRLYPWLVRHRHRLSALGLDVVGPKAMRLFARRHGAHAPAYCSHGQCRTAPHA